MQNTQTRDLRGPAVERKRDITRRVKYNKFKSAKEGDFNELHIVDSDPTSHRVPRLLSKGEIFEKAQDCRLHRHERSCPDRRQSWWKAEAEIRRETLAARRDARRWFKQSNGRGAWGVTIDLLGDQAHRCSSDRCYRFEIDGCEPAEAFEEQFPDTILRIDTLVDDALSNRNHRLHRELQELQLHGWVDVEDDIQDDWSELDELDMLM